MDAGGKIRTGKILERLSAANEITLVSNVESPKDDPHLSKVHSLCTKFVAVPWNEPAKYSLRFFFRLFFQMFSVYPVSVLNSNSKNLRIALEREHSTGKYDVALCDFVLSTPTFDNIRGMPTILFQHNVESVIAKRHAKQAGNLISRIFWLLQWKNMFSFEARACKSFNTVIAVSDQDADTFRRLYNLDNVVTIPTGVDTEYFKPDPNTSVDKNSLVFCGLLDWLPNEDAVVFFIKGILPVIRKKLDGIRFTVVGRNPSPRIVKAATNVPGIELTGWVDDIRPYIRRSALYVVPLRIGGGTRMKIFEAMAMGKTVISSSIGAEGLPVKNGENIIIEDDPVKFGEKIVHLLNDEEKRDKIGSCARTFVSRNFAWIHVAKDFSKICEVTIQKSQFLSHNSP